MEKNIKNLDKLSLYNEIVSTNKDINVYVRPETSRIESAQLQIKQLNSIVTLGILGFNRNYESINNLESKIVNQNLINISSFKNILEELRKQESIERLNRNIEITPITGSNNSERLFQELANGIKQEFYDIKRILELIPKDSPVSENYKTEF